MSAAKLAPSAITVAVLNSSGQPSVVVGQANSVTLEFTNQTGAVILIQAGTPQNPPPPGGPFGILLDFSAFYAVVEDQKSLQIRADDWTAQYFSDDFPTWSLASNRETKWNEGDKLSFTISNWTPTVPVGSYSLMISLYNLNGEPVIPLAPTVGVANPPDVKKKNLADHAAIRLTNPAYATGEGGAEGEDSGVVVITKNPKEPVQNRLILQLYNRTQDPLVTTPWGEGPLPQLTLSFVYASAPPGYYALTTPTNAAAFEVGIHQGTGWNTPVKIDMGPRWLLSPTQKNQAVLGTGVDAFVEFSIDNVVTQFAGGPTLLYLQYNNIPGYNDGFLTLVIDKEYAAMSISKFEINETTFKVDDEQIAYGYLNWEVKNSVAVDLSGVGAVPSRGEGFKVPIQQNQAMVLTAYDTVLGSILTRTINVQVQPPISARWLPCGAIAAWAGDPQEIPAGFALCDGTKGTPDLRDRFITGAGGHRGPHEMGTSLHSHTLANFKAGALTNARPPHSHLMPGGWYGRPTDGGGSNTGIDPNGEYDRPARMQDADNHQHAVNVDFSTVTTEKSTSELRPRWYALCYIMKLYPA